METKTCSCGFPIMEIQIKTEQMVIAGDGLCTTDFIYYISGKCNNGCKTEHLAVALTAYKKNEIISAITSANPGVNVVSN